MKGRFLSHRGCWIRGHNGNSKEALSLSFANGYGVEIDIRDFCGELVISHDMPTQSCVRLSEILSSAAGYVHETPVTLALNIKSNGLAQRVEEEVARYPNLDCFVFDMSVPDLRSYLRSGLKTFSRMSEVEQIPVWLESCDGVWLDSFEGEWYSNELIVNLISSGKRVCLVSPELHGRSHLALWSRLAKIWNDTRLMLCTDIPDEAFSFFSNVSDK
jgi:hypothetical protein